MNLIISDNGVYCYNLTDFSHWMTENKYRQVGCVCSIHTKDSVEIGRLVEAVIADESLTTAYLVEQYQGIAFVRELEDSDMIADLKDRVPNLAVGEVVRWDFEVKHTLDDVEIKPEMEQYVKGDTYDGTEGL